MKLLQSMLQKYIARFGLRPTTAHHRMEPQNTKEPMLFLVDKRCSGPLFAAQCENYTSTNIHMVLLIIASVGLKLKPGRGSCQLLKRKVEQQELDYFRLVRVVRR